MSDVPRVHLVCRSGGSFRPEHVARLASQITDCRIRVLTDTPYTMPGGVECIALQSRWPGWWSKMELFRPDISGDVFYMDLDTTVLRGVRNLATAGRLVMATDWYRPVNINSTLMYLPAAVRATVWDAWSKNPDEIIRRFSKLRVGYNGDQNFLQSVLGSAIERWEDAFPGYVVSYKCHMRGKTQATQHRIRNTAHVVCFHGQPRPWEIEL